MKMDEVLEKLNNLQELENLQKLENIEGDLEYKVSYRDRIRDFIIMHGPYGEAILGGIYSILAGVELLHGHFGPAAAHASVAMMGYITASALEKSRHNFRIY